MQNLPLEERSSREASSRIFCFLFLFRNVTLKQIGKMTMFEKCLLWKLVAVVLSVLKIFQLKKKRIRKKITADTRTGTVTSYPQKEKGIEAVRLGEKQ